MNPFQIFSEPIRRRIIEILASGEHSAGDLGAAVGVEFSVSRSAVSWHLRILLENGWIDVRGEENRRLYRLDDDAILKLEIAIYELQELWRRRIGVIARNDPMPEHALPIGYDRPPRLPSGEAKGLRGRGARRGPWAPKPSS